MSNGNMVRKICVNIFGFLLLLSDYMGTAVLHTDGQSLLVEKRRIARKNLTGEICPRPRPYGQIQMFFDIFSIRHFFQIYYIESNYYY
jgi:hypothetical protein